MARPRPPLTVAASDRAALTSMAGKLFVMQTRMLVLAAFLTGMAILVAGAIFALSLLR